MERLHTRLLPAVKDDLRRSRLNQADQGSVVIHQLVRECMIATVKHPFWDGNAPGAPRLLTLLQAHREVVSDFLQFVTSLLPLSSTLAMISFSILVSCEKVLRLGLNSWPGLNYLPLSLLQALADSGIWIRPAVQHQRKYEKNAVMALISYVLTMTQQQMHSSQDRAAVVLKQYDSMIDQLFLTASIVARATNLNDSGTDSHVVPCCLASIISSRAECLRGRAMSQGGIAASLVTELAEHAVLSASHCRRLSDAEAHNIRCLLSLVRSESMQIGCSSSSSAFRRATLPQIIGALHRCATRYTSLALGCARVVQDLSHALSHSGHSGHLGQVAGMRVTLHHCSRRAVVWMRLRLQCVPQRPLGPELEMLSQVALLASITAMVDERVLVHGDKDEELLTILSTPGYLLCIEALIRGCASSPETCSSTNSNGMTRCLMGAASAILLIVRDPRNRGSHSTIALYSLVITLRKVLLMIASVATNDTWADQDFGTLTDILIRCLSHPAQWCDADTLSSVSAASTPEQQAATRRLRMSVRIQVVLGICVLPLCRWRATPATLVSSSQYAVPDCDLDRLLWPGVVEGYARRFRSFWLLPNCGNIMCTTMKGLCDSHLPTQLCSGCRRVRYCSVACQRDDWIAGGHGRVCGAGVWSCAADSSSSSTSCVED